MRRFFIPLDRIDGDNAVITGSDAAQIIRVLRLRTGDTLEATDGQSHILQTQITGIHADSVELRILERCPAPARKVRVRLYQAIPKGTVMEEILEKAAELGVDSVVPLITERTIPRYDESEKEKKRKRWHKVIDEALKKVGRTSRVELGEILSLSEVEKSLGADSLKLIPWEMESGRNLKQVLRNAGEVRKVEMVIGPEGGFSRQEVDKFLSWGFQSVSLGPLILRVETATLSVLANLFYELED